MKTEVVVRRNQSAVMQNDVVSDTAFNQRSKPTTFSVEPGQIEEQGSPPVEQKESW